MTQSFTVQQFQAKWRGVTLTERSASQSHFNDLCHMLGVPTPTDADPTGSFYTFERGAEKTAGGAGWADVWFRGHFAWEYKGHHANLKKAYDQLLQYREDLENPPLLVVCDLDRFEIHTNFTGTAKKVYAFSLADLDQPAHLAVLKALWTNPNRLRPDTTPEAVTQAAAERFGALAASLQSRGVDPHRAAHFLVQLLFCLFAEDVGLLPRGLFTDLLSRSVRQPERFAARIDALLVAMRDGGDYGSVALDRFNGSLFAEIAVEPLTAGELGTLAEAGRLDWASVEPAIFGTLFERSLDPGQRAQLGAHYTGRKDIERVVEPVVLAPLRRRWAEVKAQAEGLKAQWQAASATATQERRRRRRGDAVANARSAFANALFAFQEDLAAVRVLDPACGSGNFLYVALAGLKDLEKEVVTYGAANGLPALLPRVGPAQLAGLEVNAYARELAQVVVWIGYLQWMTANGFQVNRDPVLEPLETIRLQDALLDRSEPDNPKEATWPAADFIIGNPPFLGDKRIRRVLGSDYFDDLRTVYADRVSGMANLVCYFFERARAEIEAKRAMRAGLLATTAIRVGENRKVLDRIKLTGDIFLAWANQPWLLDGASVRISIIGFDDGREDARSLDGRQVDTITSSLTSSFDASLAHLLPENQAIGFIGVQPSGKFEIPARTARTWCELPANVNERRNSDVLRPFVVGADVLRRTANHWYDDWIIDFGPNMTERDASQYEAPFEHVRRVVKPTRDVNNRPRTRQLWWIHGEARPGMRQALNGLPRFLISPIVARWRIFVWLEPEVLPGNKCVVFARSDDYFFGVLHSRAHEVWATYTAARHGVGNDRAYHVSRCFETFPLPWPPGQEPWRHDRLHAVANAARELDELRCKWLDPSGATDAELKKRTLTNLYNERPAWLDHAHAALDRAVWAAYGWDDPEPAALPDDEILARLLALNQARSTQPAS